MFTIFKFLSSLFSEQKFQELRMAKVVSGHPPEISRKKYRESNEHILAVIRTYKNLKSGIDYLVSLAHNIYF